MCYNCTVYCSDYCRFEFETALHRGITMNRRGRLIVLMALDDLTELYANDASHTAVLRQYLRQYTYINYRADDWLDKLLYALPLRGMNQHHAGIEDDGQMLTLGGDQ